VLFVGFCDTPSPEMDSKNNGPIPYQQGYADISR